MKIINKIIQGVLLVAVIVLSVAIIGYTKTGVGITYDGKSAVLSLEGHTTTYEIKEAAKVTKTRSFEHKRYDTYYELTDNEKVVYDAVLTQSINLLENQKWNNEIIIGFEKILVELDGDETYVEAKEKVSETIGNIDFKKIYYSLTQDYGYYMWWSASMDWEIWEPEMHIKDGDISETTFKITVHSTYENGDGNIDTLRLEDAVKAFENAKKLVSSVSELDTMSKLKEFKNYIINNADYNEEIASNPTRTDLESYYSRSFISVLDEKNNTTSICSGYTETFKLLCDLAGIECYKESGEMYYESSELHAWNKVYIDDVAYIVDMTNSDTETLGQDGQLFMKKVDGTDYNVYISNLYYANYKEYSLEEISK